MRCKSGARQSPPQATAQRWNRRRVQEPYRRHVVALSLIRTPWREKGRRCGYDGARRPAVRGGEGGRSGVLLLGQGEHGS